MDRVILTVDTKPVAAELARIGKDAPLAVVRALNHVLGKANTQLVRALAADVGITQQVVRKSVKAERATGGRMIATLSVTGRRIPIAAFSPRQTRRGVAHRLRGGSSPIPGAFLATVGAGHRGVFKRRGAKRLPIIELRGPSLPHVVRNKLLLQQLIGPTEAELAARLEHEIQFIISRRGTAPTGG